MVQVVVIFVIGVIFLLGSYMVYLGLVEPMVRRQQPFIPYQRHDGQQDDVGLNTFWWFQDSDASVVASDSDEPTVTAFSCTFSHSKIKSISNLNRKILIYESVNSFRTQYLQAEENIFSQPDPSASEESVDQRRSDLQMRARHSAGLHEKVISKVVAEQNKWKTDVEEQRRNVLNHSMLN
jgi:hypothetical protein